MATIVDVPLDDDVETSEAGSPTKSIKTPESPVRVDWGPMSFKLAILLWIVCSITIATLDYYQGGTSDKSLIAMMAISIGLFAASVLYLSYYVMRWVNDRSNVHETAGSTPVEVAAAQGIVFV